MAFFAIIGALTTNLPVAMAVEQPFTFSPEKGLTVKVTPVDATHVKLHILPSGKVQSVLVTEGNSAPATNVDRRFEAKDFNFDGHADLAVVTSEGMVNEVYDIFLYRPESQDFTKLEVPKQAGPSCYTLEGVEIRPRERVLQSSCRSGSVWYTEAYRFDQGGRLYLYSVIRILNDVVASHLCPGASGRESPEVIRLRFDQAGNVVAAACRPYENWKDVSADSRVQLTVGVPTLPLHDAEDDKPARRHLIKGDVVEVIDVSEDGGWWLKVLYRNPKRGPLVGWIRADEAGLSQR